MQLPRRRSVCWRAHPRGLSFGQEGRARAQLKPRPIPAVRVCSFSKKATGFAFSSPSFLRRKGLGFAKAAFRAKLQATQGARKRALARNAAFTKRCARLALPARADPLFARPRGLLPPFLACRGVARPQALVSARPPHAARACRPVPRLALRGRGGLAVRGLCSPTRGALSRLVAAAPRPGFVERRPGSVRSRAVSLPLWFGFSGRRCPGSGKAAKGWFLSVPFVRGLALPGAFGRVASLAASVGRFRASVRVSGRPRA